VGEKKERSVELLQLAERVEAASGPDRSLDCAIAVAALDFFEVAPKWEGGPIGYGYIDADGCRVEPGHGGDQLVRPFTTSLDAAMMLVPEGALIQIVGPAGKTHSAKVNEEVGLALSFPLALVSAALRARAHPHQPAKE
jgi:hypothetical protein